MLHFFVDKDKDIRVNNDISITGMSSEIAAITGAHYYLSEMHNFHTTELQYLLQFQNPLEVVADAFQVASMDDYSDVMWEIFDRQAALGGDYPLMSDENPTAVIPEKEAAVTRDELFTQIAKMHCHVETLETRKRDRLDFHEVSVWGLKAALEESYAAVASHHMAQVKGMEKTEVSPDEALPGYDSGDKPSVLEQIRGGAKETKEPHKVKPTKKKSDPEL